MNKKIILIVFIALAMAAGVYEIFLKKEKPNFVLAEIKRGNLIQEVSETGQVKKGNKVILTFKNAGRIEKIYVENGETVKKGDILAKLETSELQIQLREAESNLTVTRTKLAKLLAGAVKEEIQAAETKVDNAQISLNTARQNLEDAYEDALIVLDDAYLKAYNSQNTADLVQRTYFLSNDQAGIEVKENKENIVSAVGQIKSSLDAAKTALTHESINIALLEIKNKLSDIADFLKNIREACEEPGYKNSVSSTDKTSLDTQRTNIINVLTNIVDSQQAIAGFLLSIESANGQLQITKDNLALTTASPRQEDVDLYEAQIAQAQTQVELYENQIAQARIISPVDGVVSDVKKKAGELIQPALQDVVIGLLPLDPYEIEVDVYEEDIVKVSAGNPVEISLVAFPGRTFNGRVVSINVSEKLIEGVVYYKIIIAPEETPEGIKPGMTADIVIQTSFKENVLIVPKDGIQEKNGKTITEVLKGKNIEEREIWLGLEGKDNMVEITSGLEEGEKIILR